MSYSETMSALSAIIAELPVSFPIVPQHHRGDLSTPYARVSFVLPRARAGFSSQTVTSGLVIFEVYAEIPHEPLSSTSVITALESNLSNQTLGRVQFSPASVQPQGQDAANKSLARTDLILPFKLFGET